MINQLDQDPSFYYGGYAESGSKGYDGPGWYIWDHLGLVGPFVTEKAAKDAYNKDLNNE